MCPISQYPQYTLNTVNFDIATNGADQENVLPDIWSDEKIQLELMRVNQVQVNSVVKGIKTMLVK